MADAIPLVDISDISLLRNNEDIDDITLRKVGTEMKDAFSTYGFCYFTNHGISQKLTERLMTASQQYFNRPTDEKMKAKYNKVQSFMGWIGLECEALNLARPCDYREGFNYHAVFDDLDLLPDEFLEVNKQVFAKCLALVVRLIDALSVAMDVDRTILRNALNSVRRKENSTCVRSIYYPPIQPDTVLKTEQIRCGEHSDYGIMTLLFQDDCGGLEVKTPNNVYIPVPPIHGTIVANIGDLLQRWTADTLVATKHRVVIPEDEVQRSKGRHSIAFFTQPDDDCLITCLDGSNKYEPITSTQYLANMMY